jgi:hypothetical protein
VFVRNRMGGNHMLADAFAVLGSLAFFALCLAYARAMDRM